MDFAYSALQSGPAATAAELDGAILRLAVPALGTELLDPLLAAADTAFVGRLGADELAGVGIASTAFSFVFLFFNFLTVASSPLIAQALAACAPLVPLAMRDAPCHTACPTRTGCTGCTRTTLHSPLSRGHCPRQLH